MLKEVALWFLVGVLGGNAIPHTVKGMTKERYPCALGNGPVPNLIGGWICLVVALVLARSANAGALSHLDLAAGSIGVLMIGLFHAAVGAFGRA